jgi:LysM repeat protein
MHKLLIPFIICISFFAAAQPGVADVVEIDGKKYYEHKVEEGNTLWGMQQMYGVPHQEIVEANPGFDGLKKGAIVLVPISGEVAVPEVQTSEYKVKNKETLYGLSRKFNTTVDQLIALNPELSEGLKKGQVIRVPGEVSEEVVVVESEVISTPNPFVVDTIETDGVTEEVVISFSDSTIEHVVLAHETMYNISKRFMVPISDIMELNDLRSTSVKEGQVLIIPVRSERIDKVEIKSVGGKYDPDSKDPLVFDVKEEYNVALFLPLHLEYGEGYSEHVSNLSTQFYMGATMALDSLELKGLRAKIHVYDTKNDTNEVNAILAKEEFATMDLVIGPLLGSNMETVSRFCRMNKVRMVCPVASDAKLLENNRLVYAAVPSDISLMRGMAKYMLENCSNDNILLVKPLDEASLPMYEAFRKAFKEMEFSGTRPALVETTVGGFNTFIKRGRNNRFVVPTANRSTAVKFMNNLNRSAFRSYKDDISVFGTSEWINFTELNDAYKNKYNFHYAGSNHIDYYTDEMVEMNKMYRTKYKTDMSKVAVQAYDVLTYYCSSFFLGNDDPFLLMNDIHMNQISEFDGYENAGVFIIEQEEFELIKVGSAIGK